MCPKGAYARISRINYKAAAAMGGGSTQFDAFNHESRSIVRLGDLG